MWSLCDHDLLLVNLDMFPFNLMHVWEFGPLYFDQQVDVIEPYLCLWTWFVCAEKTTSWYFEPYLCLWTTLCLCRFQKNGQQPCWNFQRNLEYHVIVMSYVLFLSISMWPSKNLGVAVWLICLCLLVPDRFFQPASRSCRCVVHTNFQTQVQLASNKKIYETLLFWNIIAYEHIRDISASTSEHFLSLVG